MKRNIYACLSLLLLSSCLSQPPAPVEYGSSKSRNVGYSERTSGFLSDGEAIKSRELKSEKVERQPSDELRPREEKPFEYQVKKADPAPVPDQEEVFVEEVKKEDKKMKSLEQELEEIEAKESARLTTEQKPKAQEKDSDPTYEDQEVGDGVIIAPKKATAEDDTKSSALVKFPMPVAGKITTKFGDDLGGKKSNGINIAARQGAEVKSIAAGKVVYSGADAKFGNLVIIKVGSTEMFAAYAHMDDLLLEKDDDVGKGQVIGHVGSTGEATSPELHFALRQGKTPVDPVAYLIMSK